MQFLAVLNIFGFFLIIWCLPSISMNRNWNTGSCGILCSGLVSQLSTHYASFSHCLSKLFLNFCPSPNKVSINHCCPIELSSSGYFCHSWREINAQLGSKTSWLSPSHRDSGVIQQVECNAWCSTLRDLHAYTCLSHSLSLHIPANPIA